MHRLSQCLAGHLAQAAQLDCDQPWVGQARARSLRSWGASALGAPATAPTQSSLDARIGTGPEHTDAFTCVRA